MAKLKFPFDRELILGNGDFQNIITDSLNDAAFSEFQLLENVPAYPSAGTLAKMSQNAYVHPSDYKTEEEYHQQLTLNFGKDGVWTLLTTAHNSKKGNTYFGCAFWNPQSRQIVVANRGSKSLSSFSTDYFGILKNEITMQQLSACTFAHVIIAAVRQVEKDRKPTIQLFVTGHSLGGWLAHVMAFSLKYLRPDSDDTQFDRIPKDETNRISVHAPAVGFDNPGSRDMLCKMVEEFHGEYDVKKKEEVVDALDLRAYLSAPNAINTCTIHTGHVFRIFPDIKIAEHWSMGKALSQAVGLARYPLLLIPSSVSGNVGSLLSRLVPTKFKEAVANKMEVCSYWLDGLLVFPSPAIAKYNLDAHGIEGIVKTLEQEGVGIHQVVKFPRFEFDPSIGRALGNIAFAIGHEYACAFDQLLELNAPTNTKQTIEVPDRKYKNRSDMILRPLFKMVRRDPVHLENQPRKEFYETTTALTNQWRLSVFDESEQAFLVAYATFRRRLSDVQKFLPQDPDYGDTFISDKLNEYSIDEFMVCGNTDNFVPFVKRLLRLFPDLKNGVSIFEEVSHRYLESRIEPVSDLFDDEGRPEWFLNVLQKRETSVVKVERNPELVVARFYQYLERDVNYQVIYFDLETLLRLIEAFDLVAFLEKRKATFPDSILLLVLDDSGQQVNFRKVKSLLKSVFGVTKTALVTSQSENTPVKYFNADLKWSDLSIKGRKELLEKELIILQERKVSLASMLKTTNESFDDHFHTIIDESTIVKLIRNEEIKMGQDLPELEKIIIPRTFLGPQLSETFLKEILQGKGMGNELKVLAITGEDFNVILYRLFDFGIESEKVVRLEGVPASGVQTAEWHQQQGSTSRRHVIALVILSGTRLQLENDLIKIPSVKYKELENVYSYSEECYKNILNICQYWIQFSSGKFFGGKTNDSLDCIRQRITGTEINVEIFLALVADVSVVMLSDEAGSGKTTMVDILSREMKDRNPSRWLFPITLNNHVAAFKTLRNQKPLENVHETVDFFVDHFYRKDADVFEKKLLRWSLLEGGKVVLLFDGFDEISPTFAPVVENLLAILKTSRVEKIFVTTRPHAVGDLEKTFSTCSYHLRPFDDTDKINFLVRYWSKNSVPSDGEELVSKARELIDLFNRSIKDKERAFMGIPLHCRLLAEVFEDKLSSSSFSLIDLYRDFVEKKFGEEAERYGTTANVGAEESQKIVVSQLKMYHFELALRLLLDEETFSRLKNLTNFSIEIRDTNAQKAKRVGIVTNTDPDALQFVHQTFAEYFVAQYFFQRIVSPNDPPATTEMEILMMEIFRTDKFRLVRRFFNGHLENYGGDLAEKYLHYGQVIAKTWKENYQVFIGVDVKFETGLKVTILEGHESIYKFLVKCCLADDEVAMETSSFLGVRWEYSAGPFLAAAAKWHLGFATFFLDELEKRSDEVQRFILFISVFEELSVYTYEKCQSFKRSWELEVEINVCFFRLCHKLRLHTLYGKMHYVFEQINKLLFSAAEGKLEEVKAILEDEDVDEERRKFILAAGRSDPSFQDPRYGEHNTALFMAVLAQEVEVVRYLLEKGALEIPLFERDPFLIFEGAARVGNLEIFQLLLHRIESDEVKYKTITTSWKVLLASMSYYSKQTAEVSKFLLANGDFARENDEMAGRVQPDEEQSRSINLPRRNAKAVDEKGRTLLHYALRIVNFELVSFLVENGADPNAVDKEGNTPLHLFLVSEHPANLVPDDVVQLFRKLGNVNFDIENRYGDTALDVALQVQSSKILFTFITKFNVAHSLSAELRLLFWNLALNHDIFQGSLQRFAPAVEAYSTDSQLVEEALKTRFLKIEETSKSVYFVDPVLVSYFVADYVMDRLRRFNETSNEKVRTATVELVKTVVWDNDDIKVSLDILMLNQLFEKSTLKMFGEEMVRTWEQKPESFYEEHNGHGTVFHVLSAKRYFNLLKFLLDCCSQMEFGLVRPLLLAGDDWNGTFFRNMFVYDSSVLTIVSDSLLKLPSNAQRILYLHSILSVHLEFVPKKDSQIYKACDIVEKSITVEEMVKWRTMIFWFLDCVAEGRPKDLRRFLDEVIKDEAVERYLLTSSWSFEYGSFAYTALNCAIETKNQLVVDYLVSIGAPMNVHYGKWNCVSISKNHEKWQNLFTSALNDPSSQEQLRLLPSEN